MTEYTSNDQYERDKAKFFNALESFSVYSTPRLLDRIRDLLQQSKWINAYPTVDDLKEAKKIAFEDDYNSGYNDGEDDATDYLD